MRLGLISDVHANLPALEAALAALRAEGAEEVWCLGDLLGYGPSPNEVVARVREEAIPCSLGGTDERVVFPFATARHAREGVAEATLVWTREVLEDDHVAWLRTLPVQLRRETPVGALRGFHGTEDDPAARTDLRMPPRALDKLMARLGCRLLAAGGTHVPYLRKHGEGFAINPGSVGLSLNGEPGADYALIDVAEEPAGVEAPVSVRLGKAEYDVGAVAFDVIAWGLPPVIADVLRHGRMGSGFHEREA